MTKSSEFWSGYAGVSALTIVKLFAGAMMEAWSRFR